MTWKRRNADVVGIVVTKKTQETSSVGATAMDYDDLIFVGAAVLLSHVTGRSDTVPGTENATAVRKARELYDEVTKQIRADKQS
jgi:hypothetical protein